MNPILQLITAALNTVTSVIQSQAKKLSDIISVDEQATAYHSSVETSLMQLRNTQEQQETVVIAVLIIAVVLFLFMIIHIK